MEQLVEKCIRLSLPIWEECLETDFLKMLSLGNLSEECLKGYIIDDSLYLREYAKVFAWGIIKSHSMDEIRHFYSFLSFVNEAEDLTRQEYLKHFNLTDADIQRMSMREANVIYTTHMIDVAKNSTCSLECFMTLLPCMLSYKWIFTTIKSAYPCVIDTIAGKLVEDYSSDIYDSITEEWIGYVNLLSRNISLEEQNKCVEIFRQSSIDELNFWKMSSTPRKD